MGQYARMLSFTRAIPVVLLLAIFPLQPCAVAQDSAAPATAEEIVAPERGSARSTMRTFLSAMNAEPRDIGSALQCLDSTQIDPEVWKVRGKELAGTLKTVIDKIGVVELADLPDTPTGPPVSWHESAIGNIALARVSDGDAKGEWRFTPGTLHTLDALYRSLEEKEIAPELQAAGVREQLTFAQRIERRMPTWLKQPFVGLLGWQWVALFALLPLGWLVSAVARAMAARLLKNTLALSKLSLADNASRRIVRTFGVVVAILFWYYAVQWLSLPEKLLSVLLQGTKLGLGLTTVLLGYRAVDIVGGRIAANEEVRLTHFDDVLIPLLRTILRILVVVVVVAFVVDWMGQKWTTVLGALGIGGVAIAFAAQDTLGNFFGSITVLFDRPFGIGDWIVVGDIEGTVERVGFRSTRVRTFYNSMVTIPNAKMVNTHVDNFGARQFRRIKITISVTYDTPPARLDAFCEGIRELIRLHPYTRKDYYHVYFNQFAASSLDVLLYCFLEVPDWGTELRERHRLFLDILRLADRLGIEFAFPTRTVWLERGPEGKAKPPSAARLDEEDPDVVGFREAADLYAKTYGPSASRPDPVVIPTQPRSRQGDKRDA